MKKLGEKGYKLKNINIAVIAGDDMKKTTDDQFQCFMAIFDL